MFLNKSGIFWLLTLAVINFLIISQLVQDGMFMDGMLYTSVGKNLSDGLGTFWEPHFSKTTMAFFHEQPPLYFGILAIFYKVFGASMYTERLFVFVFYFISLVYIVKLWKKITGSKQAISEHTWLPVLFYSTIPVCFWAYANHVEEVVMCGFVLPSVYYTYSALFSNKKVFLYLTISGVFVFLAGLTKGVQGLFPITAVFFYKIITRKISWKKTIIYSSVLTGVPVFIYGLLFLINRNIYISFEEYFSNRFVKTFNNVYATTDNRLEIIGRLFTELLPILSVTVLIKFFSRNQKLRNTRMSFESTDKLVWLLAIGLSGSLPLAVTTEQRGFYLVTSLPYFALALALWIAPTLIELLKKINDHKMPAKVFGFIVGISFLISIWFCFSKIGHFKRDQELLSDIYRIGTIVPKGDIVNTTESMWNRWDIQTYFIRYFYISLNAGREKNKYFIKQKDLPDSLIPKEYKLYPLKTNVLNLYTLP